MADTIQIVMWALDKTCALRKQDKAQLPRDARDAISRARAYAHSVRHPGDVYDICGDVYVEGYTFAQFPGFEKKPLPFYPKRGFLLAEAFKDLEKPSDMFAMCASCDANTKHDEVAHCCGSLYRWPDHEGTEEQIRSIISRLGIKRQVEENFPHTTPIWYGLWAISPVPSQSLKLLRMIISAMYEDGLGDGEFSRLSDKEGLRNFVQFIKATEIAEQKKIALHVELLPLGHTDFDIYTIFPHCPFCKAAARIKHWQRKYPTAPYECLVCGCTYSPAETASSRGMDDEGEDLRELLGRERFRKLAVDYMVAHGETSEDAMRIAEGMEAEELKRLERLRELRSLNAKKDAFLLQHIVAGIETVSPPPSDQGDEKVAEARKKWFGAEAFAEVLRRCDAHNIAVTFMSHDSATGDFDRDEMERRIENPLVVLQRWREEGCNEKFFVSYNVPDELVRDK